MQLEKTTDFSLPKNCDLQYLHKQPGQAETLGFFPSPCRYQLGASWFCSPGLLRCPEEEGDEENQAGDGSSNYLCWGGFLGQFGVIQLNKQCIILGLGIQTKTLFFQEHPCCYKFFETILMHMLDSRDCENHEHFLWLCKGKLAAQNVVAFLLKSTISHRIFGESNVQTRYDHPDRCLFIFMFPLAASMRTLRFCTIFTSNRHLQTFGQVRVMSGD